jgi:hypothetical protein
MKRPPINAEITAALTAAGFTPSTTPDAPRWCLQLDPLHLMEADLNENKRHLDLTVSREPAGVVAIAICPPSSLPKMVADYRKEAVAKTKRLLSKGK